MIALAIPVAAFFLRGSEEAQFPLVVSLLAGIPPFVPQPTSFEGLPWPQLLELPLLYQVGIYFLWWPLLGIYLGWSAWRGETVRLITGIVFILVAVGHLGTRLVIDLALARALDGLASLLGV